MNDNTLFGLNLDDLLEVEFAEDSWGEPDDTEYSFVEELDELLADLAWLEAVEI